MTPPPNVSSGRAVASAYDAMADTYDDIEAQPFYAAQYATYAAHLEARRAMLTGTILDLGCGSGIHTLAVAPACERVIGFDVSPGLIRKAHNKTREATNAAVLVADAASLPFGDCRFDAVISYGEPLSHVTDAEAVLAEIGRVIVPGGRIVLSVDNQWNLRAMIHPGRMLRAALSPGGGARDWAFFDDAGRPVHLTLRTFTHAGLADLLERHGFRVVDMMGVHVFALLAPLATDARGGGWRARAFGWLHRIDTRLAGAWPWNRLGYSKIVSAVRVEAPRVRRPHRPVSRPRVIRDRERRTA